MGCAAFLVVRDIIDSGFDIVTYGQHLDGNNWSDAIAQTCIVCLVIGNVPCLVAFWTMLLLKIAFQGNRK